MTSLIVLSSLSFVYTQRWLRASLLGSQGGGIQVEEEFNPCIRVNGLLSPAKMIVNFVLVYTVKICSGLILYLEIGY